MPYNICMHNIVKHCKFMVLKGCITCPEKFMEQASCAGHVLVPLEGQLYSTCGFVCSPFWCCASAVHWVHVQC